MYRTRELVADGATAYQVRRLRNNMSPLTWGVHIDPEVDPWERYRLKCCEVLDRLKAGASLTGPSGAAIYDVPLLGEPPEFVYVSNVSYGRYARDIRLMPPTPVTEVDRYGGILLSAPAAMISQCAWVLNCQSSLVVADGALAMGVCSLGDLNDWAESQSGRRHVGRVRWLAHHADPRADSPGETLTRLAVTGLGYDVVSQFRVELTDRPAFVDLLVEGTKVAIEFDGLIKYRKRGLSKVVQERLREGELQAMGYTLVRLVWQQLDDVEQLDRRLRAAGARPSRRRTLLPW